MSDEKHTAGAAALTEMILETFRLNGRLLAAGDRLVAPLGLTSARWQVLGAIDAAKTPQPVSWLARNMGLNRQGVQRIVNELEKEGLVAFQANPHHRRAHLVVFTKAGRAAYAAAARRQTAWANALAKGVRTDDLRRATAVMDQIRLRLETESKEAG